MLLTPKQFAALPPVTGDIRTEFFEQKSFFSDTATQQKTKQAAIKNLHKTQLIKIMSVQNHFECDNSTRSQHKSGTLI